VVALEQHQIKSLHQEVQVVVVVQILMQLVVQPHQAVKAMLVETLLMPQVLAVAEEVALAVLAVQ
jgi:hypothetical protein